MKRTKREAAFTLVEIMLVVVIIGILAGVVLPNLVGQQEKGRIAAARAQIGSFETVIDLYHSDIGDFPETLDDLVKNNSNNANWNGPYLRKKRIPKDPWGSDYQYDPNGKNGVNFDLFSMGKDKQEGTEDDVTNWEEDEEKEQ